MVGKSIGRSLKRKKVTSNRTLRRSIQFGEGKYIGKIQSIEFVETKSGKQAIKIVIIENKQKIKGKFLILMDTDMGKFTIDRLLDCVDKDEVDIDELKGVEVGFETKYNDTFLNLKSIFPVDEYTEEEDELEEDELEEDEEIEDEYELEDDEE